MIAIPKWAYWVVGFLLAVAVAFYTGTRKGHLDEKLSINAGQLKKSDSSIKSVQIRTDSAKKQIIPLETQRGVVRTQIRVVHDTILSSGGINSGKDSIIAVSPAIAHLIQADDSLIAIQKRALALQDTLVASLRVGLSLRDQRIHLLESRGTSRISHGIQIGLGYCQTASSRVPCGYVGYGIQVRLP
jgi:hypothetical protein